MARKPKGYWKNLANVKREILAFVAAHGEPGVMPTITQLRRAGHGSLTTAIHNYHGDFHEVARKLRLSIAQRRKGYWKDFANVRREVLAFVAQHGRPGVMPTLAELRDAGHGGLVSAVHQYHSDVYEVARRLGLAPPNKPKGYWKDFANVRRELLAFIARHGIAGMMPTEGELRQTGHSSLTFAICQYHGDFYQVARRLNLTTRRNYNSSLAAG
ncbi:MAG: hypothetical protein JXB62_14925 [Pirellulales bacterium]|nr:hypothetical protein [Pirellulales bacterium]